MIVKEKENSRAGRVEISKEEEDEDVSDSVEVLNEERSCYSSFIAFPSFIYGVLGVEFCKTRLDITCV